MSKTLHSALPQKIDMDDGYFPLARTALLTLAKTKLSGSQMGIIDVIFAQTYGYHNAANPHEQPIKKRCTKAQIAYEFFMDATWMGRTEVSRAINALLNWRIIGRNKNTSPATYWFNVQVEDWSPACWRVNRIANFKQDSEPVNRIANFKQDSEPAVSRIANCCQPSAIEPQGVPGSLNKDINKINHHDDNHRVSQDLAELFAGALGRPLSNFEVNRLTGWCRQIPGELLTEAVNRALLHGKGTFAYINAILQNWQQHEISTLAEVKQLDNEFKNKQAVVIRGPTGTTAITGKKGGYARPHTQPNKQQEEKREMIQSLYLS